MPRGFALSVRVNCSIMRGAELPQPTAPCSAKCCVGCNVSQMLRRRERGRLAMRREVILPQAAPL
jgi:hypothetical protein